MDETRQRKLLRAAAYGMVAVGAVLMAGAMVAGGGRRPASLPVAPDVVATTGVGGTTPSGVAPSPRPTEPLVPTRTAAPTTTPSATPDRDPGAHSAVTPLPTATVTPRTPTATTAATRLPVTPRPTPTPGTPTPRPSSPTPLPATATAAATAAATATAEPTSVPPTQAPPPGGALFVPAGERFRLGVAGVVSARTAPALSALQAGWVMNWHVSASPAVPPGVMYAQTVRVMGGVLGPPADTLRAVAAARPGSLWLIGNEPDVPWQDGITAEQYAVLYHEAYHAIRGGDPTARVAPGGIAQPTPLRLRYLDEVLAVYHARFGEPLPAQVWQIHNYMLREERGGWGVGIPPGMPDNTGKLYAIEDSDNLELFKSHIYAFRRWMAERGYRGLPLVVTEFSNPMPDDYGFPTESRVAFLRETWRFFLTATDGGLGDPTDGGRLVQRWCWFSLHDTLYPAENLVEEDMQTWTPLGRAWLGFIGAGP